MTKVCVAGATGKMGQEVARCALADPEVTLAAATVQQGSNFLGADVAALLAGQDTNIVCSTDHCQDFSKADVAITFTLKDGLKDYIDTAVKTGTAIVIGTTGLSDEDFDLIEQASNSIPVLYAANMSLGINLIEVMIERAAQTLGDNFDVEIVEMHHKHKKDAPSGTAMSLGMAIASGRGVDLADHSVLSRATTPIHQQGDIGFSSLRGGGVFGDHEVIFASQEEVITFGHRAMTRAVFAKGAIRAAKWLVGKKPGLYSMKDVLDI